MGTGPRHKPAQAKASQGWTPFKDLKSRAGVRLEEDEVRPGAGPSAAGRAKFWRCTRCASPMAKGSSSNGWTYHFKPGERVGLGRRQWRRKEHAHSPDDGREDQARWRQGGAWETLWCLGILAKNPLSFDEGMKVIEALNEIADFMPLKKGTQTVGRHSCLSGSCFPRKPATRLHPQTQRRRAQKAAPAPGAHGKPQLPGV